MSTHCAQTITARATTGLDPILGVVTNVAADGASMEASFNPVQAAAGAWTLVLDEQYSPYAEVANAFTAILGEERATAAPKITGTVAVGSSVKAAPAAWTPEDTPYDDEAQDHRYGQGGPEGGGGRWHMVAEGRLSPGTKGG